MPALEKREHSPELEQLILYFEQLVHLTGGRFDPSIEPVQQLWKTALAEGRTPDAEQLASLQDAIGWNKVHLENGVFWKDHDQTMLDLGGVAKGLCVDLIVEQLNRAGYADVYFEWGGEIRASGRHPENRPWRVFVSRFGNRDPDQALAIVELVNQSIATSGDYMQNWTIQNGSTDQVFFHIVDPSSGSMRQLTRNSIGSVSVRCQSCMLADALATAGMIFDSEETARAWMDQMEEILPEAQFWIASHEGSSDES
jgi:thiamine biosynthesis lipoprotein